MNHIYLSVVLTMLIGFMVAGTVENNTLITISGVEINYLYISSLSSVESRWMRLPNVYHDYRKYLKFARADDESILLIGEDQTGITRLDLLNLRTMQITNLTFIKTPIGYVVTVANKRIYIAGGDDLESGPIPLNVYDMNTNLWYKLSPMLQGRTDFKLIHLVNVLYALGVQDHDTDLDSIEYFDEANNCWQWTTPMDHVRRSFGVTTYANGIVVAGGKIRYDDNYFGAEYFNPNTSVWSEMAACIITLPTAVVFQDNLLVMGYDSDVAMFDSEKQSFWFPNNLRRPRIAVGIAFVVPSNIIMNSHLNNQCAQN